MSIERLKSEIANDFGTPALVIDLDRVPLVAVGVFPGAAPQAPVDAHLAALGQILGAELGLLVPHGDPHEVGLVLPRPVDGEHEAGHLQVVSDLPELDLRGEIPDQRDDVQAHLLC